MCLDVLHHRLRAHRMLFQPPRQVCLELRQRCPHRCLLVKVRVVHDHPLLVSLDEELPVTSRGKTLLGQEFLDLTVLECVVGYLG